MFPRVAPVARHETTLEQHDRTTDFMQAAAPPFPRASVIIVNWNGLEHLCTCLPSVVAQEYPDVEILLLDNASSDGSPEWAEREYGERVQVIRTGSNLG